ncbi:MAG: hypothetical protein SH817_05535 [Leptospira sp.]|nr:hypothetical protein [Leptospira sp.]
MKKKIFYYLLIIIFLLGTFRLLDYLTFAILNKNPNEGVKKYPPNSEFISITSDFVYLSETNSLGIRNDELGEKKNKRILFLGDSFVYGVGVEKEERMTELLSSKLKESNLKFEVINAGVIGTCPRESLALYKDLNPHIKPDYVVLNLYTNDIYESGDDFITVRTREVLFNKKKWLSAIQLVFPKTVNHLVRYYIKSSFINMQADSGSTVRLSEKYDKAKNPSLQKIKLSKKEIETKLNDFLTTTQMFSQLIGITPMTFNFWKEKVGPTILLEASLGRFSAIHVLLGLYEPTYFQQSLNLNGNAEEKFDLLTESIKSLKSETDKNNQKLILTYIPSEFQYDTLKLELGDRLGYVVDKSWLTSKSQLEIALEEFSSSNDIPFFSMTDHFRKNASKKLVWEYDIHWNQNGNKVAAEAILPFLQKSIKE